MRDAVPSEPSHATTPSPPRRGVPWRPRGGKTPPTWGAGSHAAPSSPASPSAERLLHSGMNVSQYFGMHLLGALFPLTAGLLLYGWRALFTLGFVAGAAAIAVGVWRQIGSRGRDLEMSHALWLAMLLGLMLPPHLAAGALGIGAGSANGAGGAGGAGGGDALWPIPLAAGGLLVMCLWLFGGLGTGRIHPVVVTYLIVAALFPQQLTPHWVLQRNRLVAGDVLRGPAGPTDDPGGPAADGADAWIRRPRALGQDALWAEPAAQSLTAYTTGRLTSARGQVPLHELLRDRMPPLEDLIVGGQPGPIGLGSAIAVIIGGLFLLYRGVIDFRIPLLVTLAAFAALLVLPVPTVVTAQGAQFRWLALREADVQAQTAITFANYEIMASPVLFVAFFLATAAPLRPMSRRARVVYSVVLGVACAAAQLYWSASVGPYIALLAVSLVSPEFDRLFKPRALV